MNTLSTLEAHPLIREHCPVLSETARLVASPQIRNVGVIGGNILQDRRCMYFNQTEFWRAGLEPCFKTGGRVCHQAPGSSSCRAIYYSDLAPLLMVMDARVEYFTDCGYKYDSLQKIIHQHVLANGSPEGKIPLSPDLSFPTYRMVPGSNVSSTVFVPHSIFLFLMELCFTTLLQTATSRAECELLSGLFRPNPQN